MVVTGTRGDIESRESSIVFEICNYFDILGSILLQAIDSDPPSCTLI